MFQRNNRIVTLVACKNALQALHNAKAQGIAISSGEGLAIGLGRINMVASAEARHGSLFGNQCAHRRQIICISGAHILGLPESFSHTHKRLQAESDLDVLSTHFAKIIGPSVCRWPLWPSSEALR
jgi:hypothetical protein